VHVSIHPVEAHEIPFAGANVMDAFEIRRQLINDYSTYVRSFINIRDRQIHRRVHDELDSGLLWPDPLIVPGRGVLVTELIGIAGGDSITARDSDDYPRYSLEAAVAKGPEVIVLANHGSKGGPIALDRWQRLTSLPAIKTGRVHSVDGNLMHRYGPRFLDGLDQLARAIHPEAFR